MLNYNTFIHLPSAQELPDSDETPVDNELQNLIPGLLKSILALIWSERWDWFFGVDMGIYYHPDSPAIVPDGFLSLGVQRVIDEALRLSYVFWEEQRLPTLVLEVVSQTYRGEYSTKKELYAKELGILYYIVYNPRRKRKPRLEVYKLINREYVLLTGDPVWLPEIGLGIGKERRTHQGITREWLYWYNEQGERYLTSEERTQAAEQRFLESEQRAQLLAEMLINLGINPQNLPEK